MVFWHVLAAIPVEWARVPIVDSEGRVLGVLTQIWGRFQGASVFVALADAEEWLTDQLGAQTASKVISIMGRFPPLREPSTIELGWSPSDRS